MEGVLDNVFEADGGKRQYVDMDGLREGELVFPTSPTMQQMTAAVWFRQTGIRFVDGNTWKEWRLHPTLFLWQAVALSLHLDPDSIKRNVSLGRRIFIQWCALDERNLRVIQLLAGASVLGSACAQQLQRELVNHQLEERHL